MNDTEVLSSSTLGWRINIKYSYCMHLITKRVMRLLEDLKRGSGESTTMEHFEASWGSLRTLRAVQTANANVEVAKAFSFFFSFFL